MPKRNFKLCRWRDEGEKNLKGPRQFFVELLPNHSTEAGYFILILTSKDSQPEDLDEVPKGAGIWKDGARESRAFKEPQPGSCTSSVSPPRHSPPRLSSGLLPATPRIRSKQLAVYSIRRPSCRVLPPFAFGWAL